MNNLVVYGWNENLSRQKLNSGFSQLEHGRVTVTNKTCYEVVSELGNFTCELSGNLMFSRKTTDYPCTGDWVIFQCTETVKGIILDVLPRIKTLYRLKSGKVSEKQDIASHVDKAFMVQSLDKYFNVRRIERFMVQVADEKIQPVLVLTKTDLGYDQSLLENELKHILGRIPVFYTSILQPESIEKLKASVMPGETVVFVGMSGAGKSTLINAICGIERLNTSEISGATGKGRHTTTRREMVLIDGSVVLIDTPGVKLFGVTNDDGDSLSEVMDLGRFEGQCRYSDCKHINERGCAVIKALEEGLIDRAVYDNYIKLRKEAVHYTASVHEKRQYERSFAKMIKHYKNEK